MEAQNSPSKLACSSETGMGLICGGKSPSIGLDLGLGSGLTHGKSAFTLLQFQELEHQALIFKYMVSGVPVPSHLILPIWKSYFSSPSFVGYKGLSFVDYRNNTEPEPGRCRRTDGKKWRCSKEVVADQKYCERHMHRGRNRSRKHVETTSQIIASSSNNLNESNINLSISINNNSTNNNSNTSNVVSPILGFSPKSVLQSGPTYKTEESSL